MKLIILLLSCLAINANAKEKKANIQVSATIVYNCTIPDPKADKYCKKYVAKEETNGNTKTITLYY